MILEYLNAALALVFLVISGSYPEVFLLLALGEGVAAFGTANEKRWGYLLGVGASGLYLLFTLYAMVRGSFGSVITLLFAGVLVALLLHPQSREYQKVWFR